MNENKQELLELYKLHATAAENTIKHKASHNQFAANILFPFLLLYFGLFRNANVLPAIVAENAILYGGCFGIILSFKWWLAIYHCKKTIAQQITSLTHIEHKMNNELFAKELGISTYYKHTQDYPRRETIIPVIFMLAFAIGALLLWVRI